MAALEPYGDFICELFDTGKTRRDHYRSKAFWCPEVLRYEGEEVLCGAQPSKKKSSFRFSFRSSTRRLSRRLPWETIKLAIIECERLDGTFETSLYVLLLFIFKQPLAYRASVSIDWATATVTTLL